MFGVGYKNTRNQNKFIKNTSELQSLQRMSKTYYTNCLTRITQYRAFNPLKAELNPICYLLALLEGATIVVVSRLRVNNVLRDYNHL